MRFRLLVTDQARDDISRNAAWWAEHHSLEEALKWYDSVYSQLNELLNMPFSFALAAENDSFSYELRERLVGGRKRTYRAIFTVRDEEVRVLAVRRAAQNALRPDDIEG